MVKDQSTIPQITSKESQQRVLVEEINGLIRVYNNGHVERPQIVPCVDTSSTTGLGITCKGMIIDKYTNIWARLYVPNVTLGNSSKLPLVVYFNGGGFCVGFASWISYHAFLAKLSSMANCVIISVNYRLALENPLPAAYDDSVKAVIWTRQPFFSSAKEWWTRKCNFHNIFIAGDSVGVNIAYNVTLRLRQLDIKGLILMQPFVGGKSRTQSELYTMQPPHSALTLAASNTYWRLSLPVGANCDHPWCNQMAKGVTKLELKHLPIMISISEMDTLKDRNLELCANLASSG